MLMIHTVVVLDERVEEVLASKEATLGDRHC
jgi:hypothetical protein